MSRLNIDGDLIVYACASACDGKYYKYLGDKYHLIKDLPKDCNRDAVEVIKEPASIEELHKNIDKKVNDIIDAVWADEYHMYISGKSNFRYSLATIQPYKGNRDGLEKPFHYDNARQYLTDEWHAEMTVGIEADDALGLAQTEGTMIATLDKDIDCVPGMHFNWVKGKEYDVSLVDANRNFYCQVLTGDTTDNIPGLYKVGAASAYCKRVREYTEEVDMFNEVLGMYKNYFGSYAKQFMLENCKLLWILQKRKGYWEGKL